MKTVENTSTKSGFGFIKSGFVFVFIFSIFAALTFNYILDNKEIRAFEYAGIQTDLVQDCADLPKYCEEEKTMVKNYLKKGKITESEYWEFIKFSNHIREPIGAKTNLIESLK